jgi:hypothetical protein
MIEYLEEAIFDPAVEDAVRWLVDQAGCAQRFENFGDFLGLFRP